MALNPQDIPWEEVYDHLQKWEVDFASESDYEFVDRDRVDTWAKANAVSSEIVLGSGAGKHAILLDIDYPAWLTPSSTKDHHHLYVDVHVEWWRYRVFLWACKFVGLVEPGYYRASVARKATFLRTPAAKKKNKTK